MDQPALDRRLGAVGANPPFIEDIAGNAGDKASPPPSMFTSVWVTPSCRAMIFTASGRMSPSSSTIILFLALRRLKNSFFWFSVVPIFINKHERRMYSWIAALIHHVA